jgi:hypothetical protein
MRARRQGRRTRTGENREEEVSLAPYIRIFSIDESNKIDIAMQVIRQLTDSECLEFSVQRSGGIKDKASDFLP